MEQFLEARVNLKQSLKNLSTLLKSKPSSTQLIIFLIVVTGTVMKLSVWIYKALRSQIDGSVFASSSLQRQHATTRNIPAWHHVNSKGMLSWGSVRIVHKKCRKRSIFAWLLTFWSCNVFHFIQRSDTSLYLLESQNETKSSTADRQSTLNV